MKRRPFWQRVGFALQGIRVAFASEASFRAQLLFAAGALVLLLTTRPAPIWWALLLLTASGVLAAELINTALEFVVDRLHPDQHPMIGRAKDCAAGAVLLLSLSSVAIGALLIWDQVLRAR